MNKINVTLSLLLGSLFFMGCATTSYQSGLRPVEPQVTDAVHHEGRFAGVQETRLFEQSWTPLKGNSKAVLIIVHGLKDHSSRYAEVARKLTQSSFSVYAFDLRGHGDSEGRRVWTDSFDDYISDLEIFYDRVQKAEPNKPIFLFGHSMGGAIVTTFVLKKSRPVAGMVLSAPALKVTDDIGSFLIGTTKMLGTITPSLAVLDLENKNFSRDPKVVESMDKDPLIYQGKGPARTAKELLKAIANIQEKMSEVTIPFITLHGTKDYLTNTEGSRELFKLAKSSDKAIRIYDGVYHILLAEPEKDKIYGDMLAWLNSHAPPGELQVAPVKKSKKK